MIKKLTFLVMFILTCQSLFAQTPQTIKGKIIDENGSPLAGATVHLTIENKTVSTDVKGDFSITSNNADNKLRITFVGYKSHEFDLATFKSGASIVLEKEGNNLNEVVVIGYGTSKKKDLTGAVSTVSGDLIAERKSTTLSLALEGTIPGVSVTENSGAPGTTGTIRVRGITTLGVNDPLVIVDGVPSTLDNVNPDDVDNISVLKDASSSAIYGSRAAAGVILVTTKRAKNGESRITYNAYFGWQRATMFPTFADVPTYMTLYNEMKVNDGASPLYPQSTIDNYKSLNATSPDLYPNTNWIKDYFHDYAFQQTHNINIAIGTKNVKTEVSAGYLDQNGLDRNRSFNRYSLRVNNDLTITSKLSANVDLSYYRGETKNATSADIAGLIILPGIYDDYYSDGRYAPSKAGGNPIANNDLGGRTDTRTNQLNARLQLNYTPFKGFKLSAMFAPQLTFYNQSIFSQIVSYTDLNDPSVVINTFNTTNSLTQNQEYNQVLNSQLLANYEITIAGDHNISALLGYEDNEFHDETTSEYRDGYILTDYQQLNAGALANARNSGDASESALRSYFGRVNYSYKNKYLLSVSARYDGSSRFAVNDRWGFFPSVSGGWVVTEEPWFKNTPFSFLKVKASWGRNGNQQIGNYSYQSLVSLSSVLFYNSAGVITPATAGNQLNFAVNNITWETKQDYNIGAEMAFLANRLNVSADYYDKKTFNILLTLPIPLSTGLVASPQNAGKMDNKGWELQVGWRDKIGSNWSYSASVNLSDNVNKVLDLKGTSTLGSQAILEGQPYDVWYGYKALGYFKDAADVASSAKLTGAEKPGDIKYQDLNNDGKITADKDQVPLGNSLPRYLYGGNASIKYKNIDFEMSFQGVGKQLGMLTSNIDMVQPFTQNFGNVPSYYPGNYWTPANPNARFPRLTYNNANVDYATSSFWEFNAAYFRLKDVSLGYTFKPGLLSYIGAKSARLYVSGTNLFTASHFPKGWDPEIIQGYNPIVKTYITGVSVTF